MRFHLLASTALLLCVTSCEPTAPPGPSVPANETFASSLGVDIPSMVKIDDNLYYKDITVGTGSPAAASGKTIIVNYSGYLTDGTAFTTNLGMDPDTIPLTIQSGLIAGWTLGIPGMKPGGVRKLVIGSSYAYGSQGRSKGSSGLADIPKNATLIFDISLKAVK